MIKPKRRADNRYRKKVPTGLKDSVTQYKYVYGYTIDELEENVLNLKLQLRQGIDVSAAGDSFKDWSKRWLLLKKNDVSASRYSTCKSHLAHLIPQIGHMPIISIETMHIQDIILNLSVLNSNTKRPASKNLMTSIKNTAEQIFNLTIENMVLIRNPASFVRIPNGLPPSNIRRALTAEEQSWVLNTPHRAKRSAMIMMYAGLRRGELIALLWDDVDFPQNTIVVNKSIEKIDGRFQLKIGAKTKSGTRVITMPDILTQYLKKEKREGIYVSVSARGQMHTESSWRRMWHSYLLDMNILYGDFTLYSEKFKARPNKRPESKNDPLGVPFIIPNITPHWLRHTYATLLYFSEVDALTAKELMGHKDIKTTLDIYTHLDQTHKKKNILKLNNYLNDNNSLG